MTILHVALPSPLRRLFDYRLPAHWPRPAPGQRVRVPFGRRELVGVVVAVDDTSSWPADQLKLALALLDSAPVLPPALWQLALWAASYYQHPLGDAWQQMLPALLRQGEPVTAPPPSVWRLTALGRALAPAALARAPRQQAAWAALAGTPDGLSEAMLSALQVTREALRSLQAKALAERVPLPAAATPAPVPVPPGLRAGPGLALNDEQAAAVQAITAAVDFQVFLLHGVTGSGKTEVYLQAMAHTLQRGDQVLLLVPEIGLAPQTMARLQARFACPVVLLHSGLTDKARLDAWRAAADGRAGIVVGTRSAVFVPLARPGLIVVDEEHDASFKQQEGFRYHGRDVAVRRAQLEQVPVVLGSATPALESLANVQAGRYQRLLLTRRAGSATPPRLSLLDVRGQRLRDGLLPYTLAAMAETLAAGEQVLLFLNRRGYAPVLMCHDCGWQADCPRCDARPTVHQAPSRLHCHHCGHERPPPVACPGCGSTDLRPLGIGTERLETALAEQFRQVPVVRIDRDSTRRKGALDERLKQVQSGSPMLLVGTQMLAKGHHFPQVTLVVIPDVDGALFSADFRGGERLLQLLVQVAGRAGRGERPGRVLLQTHHPEHPLLQCLFHEGFSACARLLLRERELMQLPPVAALALLRAESPKPDAALQFLQQAAELSRTLDAAAELWGPVPAPMARKAGLVRAHLLLKLPQRQPLQRLLQQLLPRLDEAPAARQVRWSVDVDPQEML